MTPANLAGQFGDTTYTKVFVGGLAWETQKETMKKYFEQFGEILEAVVITDKATGRSKGYGFVCFFFYFLSHFCLHIDLSNLSHYSIPYIVSLYFVLFSLDREPNERSRSVNFSKEMEFIIEKGKKY